MKESKISEVCTTCGSRLDDDATTLIFPAPALVAASDVVLPDGSRVAVVCVPCAKVRMDALESAPFSARKGYVGWERRPAIEPRYQAYGPPEIMSYSPTTEAQITDLLRP